MISNLGSLYLTLMFMLTVIPLFLLITRPFKHRSKKLSKLHRELTDSLRGNMFIRYLLQASIDIAITTYINY